MPERKHVMVVFGTRPEAIKMAPIIEELQKRPSEFTSSVIVTAQHREMLDQVLRLFGIAPDEDLDIMTERQTLDQVAVRALSGLSEVIRRREPDVVLVQGDTTTTFAAALAAFYARCKVGHVEAGLRTGDKQHPFPEELNRRLVTPIADYHFAATTWARDNLLAEHVDAGDIWVTGNTVIDAVLQAADMPYDFEDEAIGGVLASGDPIVLVTAHRRENWGEPMRRICAAVAEISHRVPEARVLFSVHLNPEVQSVAHECLDGEPRVLLTPPLDYLPFVKLMQAATVIVSDSGGMQEEAPSLGKPVLVLREVTERPEAVEAGTARLVGRDTARIASEAVRLLTDESARAEMSRVSNPYGDGTAARRIVDALAERL